MLSSISMSNFKSIEKINNLQLKPLTIFTGKNSSGKSNILEAIAVFGQGARRRKKKNQSNFITEVFRYGDTIKYPFELENFIAYKLDPKNIIELEIKVEPDSKLIGYMLKEVNRKEKPSFFTRHRIAGTKSVGYSFSFGIEEEYFSERITIGEKTLLRIDQKKSEEPKVYYPKTFKDVPTRESVGIFFSRPVLNRPISKTDIDQLIKSNFSLAGKIVDYIEKVCNNIFLISGERGKIDTEIELGKEDQISDEDPTWVGYNGQHLIDILSRAFSRYPEEAKKIEEWASKFQLPEIFAGYVGRRRLESSFKDETLTDKKINSSLAGLGARQMLSIITQIFWSNTNDVILIEEPEISLHPENQVLLHEMFAEAIGHGKQIICSTHSPFFILALSRIIKKKLLDLNDIVIYEVNKGTHGTKTKQLKLNKHGFIEGGIPSFMEIEEELFKDWSESLEEE